MAPALMNPMFSGNSLPGQSPLAKLPSFKPAKSTALPGGSTSPTSSILPTPATPTTPKAPSAASTTPSTPASTPSTTYGIPQPDLKTSISGQDQGWKFANPATTPDFGTWSNDFQDFNKNYGSIDQNGNYSLKLSDFDANGNLTPKAQADLTELGMGGSTSGDMIQQAKTALNANKAATSAYNQYTGDVGDFTSQIPAYRMQAVDNVVGRGLSSSFDPNSTSVSSGALGSQVMNGFNQNVGSTLGSMADSYNQFQGDLSLQEQARQQALQNFMANQQYYNQYQQQQQPGLSDIAGIGAGIAGLL
jgi:hypothetical protein